MKLQYLGTGASEGFPALFCECAACRSALEIGGRNIKSRSCALLNDRVLVDVSPDLYMQKLRYHLNLGRVENIVVTHSDEDHFDVFSLMLRGKESYCEIDYTAGGAQVVGVFGNEQVQCLFEKGAAKKLKGRENRLTFTRVKAFEEFFVSDSRFIPLLANHRQNEDCFLYVIEQDGKRILYANDTDALPSASYERIRGIKMDVVSMDCARGPLPGDGHMGLSENQEMRRLLHEFGCVGDHTRFLLTHISHMSGLTHDGLEKLAVPLGFEMAYDGMILEV
jgi:phosphoribosyl 1,2-cyclic phosphate phosphodiesterase